MDKVRLADLVGRDNVFVNMHDAVVYCQGQLQERGVSYKPGVVGWHLGGGGSTWRGRLAPGGGGGAK